MLLIRERERKKRRRRKAILDRNDIERYVLRGHGSIFLENTAPKGENPLQLATISVKKLPKYFSPCFKRLKQMREEKIIGIKELVA